MDNISSGIIGIVGCMLTSTTAQTELTTWVSVICSAVIALVTCGLQVYHMIRDRDKDTTEEDEKDDTENEE